MLTRHKTNQRYSMKYTSGVQVYRPARGTMRTDIISSEERLCRAAKLIYKGILSWQARGCPQAEMGDSATGSSAATPVSPAPAKIRGRIPFGQCLTPEGRQLNMAAIRTIGHIRIHSMAGLSSEKIARCLNDRDFPGPHARKWSRTAVWRVLQRPATTCPLQNQFVT